MFHIAYVVRRRAHRTSYSTQPAGRAVGDARLRARRYTGESVDTTTGAGLSRCERSLRPASPPATGVTTGVGRHLRAGQIYFSSNTQCRGARHAPHAARGLVTMRSGRERTSPSRSTRRGHHASYSTQPAVRAVGDARFTARRHMGESLDRATPTGLSRWREVCSRASPPTGREPSLSHGRHMRRIYRQSRVAACCFSTGVTSGVLDRAE